MSKVEHVRRVGTPSKIGARIDRMAAQTQYKNSGVPVYRIYVRRTGCLNSRQDEYKNHMSHPHAKGSLGGS